jgi:carotenoid cleavage dioxygenase-like enzyme
MNNIDRREFLRRAGAGLGVAGGLWGCGVAEPGQLDGADAGPDRDAGSRDAGSQSESVPALAVGPFPASACHASREELDVDLRILSGSVPTDAFGHAFTVAALPFGDGTPVVNGDGMVYRLDFGNAAVGLRTRIAKTPCYYADQATRGKSIGFENRGIVRMSNSLGTRNQANTAFVVMGDRLALAFDGGRPYEIDPVSLAVVTPIGRTSEWTPAMPPLAETIVKGPFKAYMSGAHPVWDEVTRELFAVNYTGTIPLSTVATYLLRWDGEGAIERFRLLLEDGSPARITMSAHQLAVTEDYVLVVDTAFLVESEQLFFPDMLRAESPDTTLYIVSRRDLRAGSGDVSVRRVVLPRELAHVLADYENPEGRITMHVPHGAGWLPSEWLRGDDVQASSLTPVRRDLLGMLVTSSDATPIARYVLDGESGERLDAKLLYHDDYTWSVNLYTHAGSPTSPRFDDMYWTSVGFQPELLTRRVFDQSLAYKYRHTPVDELPFRDGKRGSLFRTNMRSLDRADMDGFVFPPGRIPSSPQFVPSAKRSGARAGYVVCTVVSDEPEARDTSGDEFWIFDAARLSSGPVCRLGHPQLSFGYTLHTTWMKELRPRVAAYHVPIREDYGPLVQNESGEVRELFEREIYPRFA